MPVVWIVSEDPVFPETLAHHLSALGDVEIGPPEPWRFKEATAPDLVVTVAREAPVGDLADLDRLLTFLAAVPHHRRAPPPVLFVEPASGQPSARVARRLIDDRPVTTAGWPIDPDQIVDEAASLIDEPATPIGLRERERRAWVSARVERFYAGVDLPALRHAIDPRNARRPVLLSGEPGTARGLLARYIHDFAEPPREALIALPAVSLVPGLVEAKLLEISAGRRVTIYLEDVDRLAPALQSELGQVLFSGGLAGIDALRWIASVSRPRGLHASLAPLGAIRVDVPPLRDRADRPDLISEVAAAVAEHLGSEVRLSEGALGVLNRYGWPGNLRELEAVLQASIAGAAGETLDAGEVTLARGRAVVLSREDRMSGPARPEPPDRPEAGPIAEVEAEPIAAAPGAVAEEAEPIAAVEPQRPEEPVVVASAEPEETVVTTGVEPSEPAAAPRARAELAQIVNPLADELRRPLLAIRTCAALVEQRPDDPEVRRELSALVDRDLGMLEETLQRLEGYGALEAPDKKPLDLAAIVSSELEKRRARMGSLVVLEELERDVPPALAGEAELRFALGGLLDRSLRMVPEGGDLYIGSLYHPAREGAPAHHRLLIRFHSPEEVLAPPDDVPGASVPLEVVFARSLIERMGGAFAVDASGDQDNVVLIDLPA